MISFFVVLAASAAAVSAPMAPPTRDTPAVTAVPPASQAPLQIGYFTAGQLADRCTDATASSASYCFGYIAAVHDSVRAYEQWLNTREFCTLGDIPQGELRRTFLTYLSAYPANRSGQAASVIVVALKEFYPCVGVVSKP